MIIMALWLALGTVPAPMGGTNCPDWLSGVSKVEPLQCWAPMIVYRDNVAQLNGDPAYYKTRMETLVESVHTFDTRAEVEAYAQDVLAQRGFWVNDPIRCDNGFDRCVFVPPSAIDRIEARQIIDHGVR